MKKLSLFLIALAMILVSCKPEIEKPTVVTKSVGEVAKTSAKVVGQVAADGGAEVTERGVCWSTDGTPTILDYRVKDVEGGLGSYDVIFTDLVPNTQYYVRAYATNEAGTGYGDEKTFTTLGDEPEEPGDEPEEPGDEPEEPGEGDGDENEDPETPVDPEEPGDEPEEPGDEPETPEQPEEVAPAVTTAEVTDIKLFSAVCGGEVVSNGEYVVVARGVCWSMEQNPTIEDSHTTDGISTGTYTSNLTELNHSTTYYVRAYAINAKGITVYGEEVSFTTLAAYSPATGSSNGYGYVDLGLSVKWATCNVGASSPEEYGDYFAWGETTTKDTYSSSNCPTYGLDNSQLQSQGYIDGEGNLTAQHDAARAKWGGDWRMPTYDELRELNTKCTWEWINTNDFKGYKVTGPNGNSIFLPAAGYRDGSSLYGAGSGGYYWSSTPFDYYDFNAYYLYFNSSNLGMINNSRYYGRSVRPVLE